jgi:hypothetical protein
MRQPPVPHLHQRSLPMKAISVTLPVNPHLMTTQAKQGFQLPTTRITMSTTSSSALTPMPSSVRVTLVDLNWHCTMGKEFAALITNNT